MEKWREDLYVDALRHHGIKGQKWGVRRYQNADGTLTAAGKERYKHPDGYLTRAGVKKYLSKKSDKKYEKLSKDCERLDRLHSSLDTSGLSESDIDNIFDVAYTKVGREISRSLSELDKKTISAYYHDSQLQEELLEKRGFTKQTSGLALVAMAFADDYEALSDTDKRSYDKLSNDIFNKYNLDEKLFGKQVKHSDMDEMSHYGDIGRQWVEDLTEDLEHHGTKGQKWGRRRFQNEDGSLTALGRERYGIGDPRDSNDKTSFRFRGGHVNVSADHRSGRAHTGKVADNGYEGKYLSDWAKDHYGKVADVSGGKFAKKSNEKGYEGKYLSDWAKDHYGKVVDVGDGKFTKKAAEYRKDDREALANKAMMDDIQKNVQEILNKKKPITEAELLEIRKNNKKVNEAIDKASQKSFDEVVNDVASSNKLGEVAKKVAKNVKKEDIEKASKAAGEAAAKGENPDAAFAKSIIESTGKNMRAERAKTGGTVNGAEVAKTAIAFYERFKDLPTALNSLGSHAGKISEIYSETKAYQRLKNIDLQSMSNADLKREIDRLTLEQNYTRLVASNSQAGEKKVKNIINGVGSSIQIGGSAVMLANAISKARKKYN